MLVIAAWARFVRATTARQAKNCWSSGRTTRQRALAQRKIAPGVNGCGPKLTKEFPAGPYPPTHALEAD